MSDKVQVLEARSESDRQKVGRLHSRLFDLSANAIEKLESILTDKDADPRDVKWAVKIVLERTVAPVQRIDMMALIARLQPAEDPALKSVEVRDQRAKLRETLKRLNWSDRGEGNGLAH